METIKANSIEANTIIQSFDFRTLQVMHKKYSNIKTAMLIEDDDKRNIDQQIATLGFVPNIYSPHYSLVNKERITYCKAKKMLLIPWTVNDIEKMQELKNLGVDGIISDYPNLFKNLK
jgi:glycerophosphoryl diester phosphodiesterase